MEPVHRPFARRSNAFGWVHASLRRAQEVIYTEPPLHVIEVAGWRVGQVEGLKLRGCIVTEPGYWFAW